MALLGWEMGMDLQTLPPFTPRSGMCLLRGSSVHWHGTTDIVKNTAVMQLSRREISQHPER